MTRDEILMQAALGVQPIYEYTIGQELQISFPITFVLTVDAVDHQGAIEAYKKLIAEDPLLFTSTVDSIVNKMTSASWYGERRDHTLIKAALRSRQDVNESPIIIIQRKEKK